jgi:hypothetical protein
MTVKTPATYPKPCPKGNGQWNFDKKIVSFDFALQNYLRCHANKALVGGIWYT